MKGKGKVLAIIPARSGSKGLAHKNIRPLNGKPMIAYTIQAAIDSGIFDYVMVSTDSEKYADISRTFGADVPFLRDTSLATDRASSYDVVEHTLEELTKRGECFDHFMLLQPTSPLRSSQDIVRAWQLLHEKRAKFVISVCETDHPPMFANTLEKSLCMDGFLTRGKLQRRQEYGKYYRLNGAIYLGNTKEFLATKTFYTPETYAYVMDKVRSVDVDDELDFFIADCLLKYWIGRAPSDMS